jgi:hypothetical protein
MAVFQQLRTNPAGAGRDERTFATEHREASFDKPLDWTHEEWKSLMDYGEATLSVSNNLDDALSLLQRLGPIRSVSGQNSLLFFEKIALAVNVPPHLSPYDGFEWTPGTNAWNLALSFP